MTLRFLTALPILLLAIVNCDPAALAAESPPPGVPDFTFNSDASEYRFDTGLLRGTLHSRGRSLGLAPVIDTASGRTISGSYGLFSHYRLLDVESRYGAGAWDWASEARRLSDGAVEVRWTADKDHPFDMQAVYRWKSADTLDLTTTITAKKDLQRFEVFLASYFAGFPQCSVYARPADDAAPAFVPAVKSAGEWQMFPRDEPSAGIIRDGRWKRLPHPVDWAIMPRYAAPLAIRRDAQSGLAAVVMAPADACFAVATPYGEEGHRSVYLCLLGRNLNAGQTVTAPSRLIIGRNISDEQAVRLYEVYMAEVRKPAGETEAGPSGPTPRR